MKKTQAASSAQDKATESPTLGGNRHRLQRAAMVLAVLLMISVIGYWVQQRATHVYSDDARIASSMIKISAQASGQLMNFPVVQGQSLAAGDLIAQIEDSEARFMLAELESELNASLTNSAKLLAQIEQVTLSTGGSLQASESKLQAALASQEAARFDLELKGGEWERAKALLGRKIISAQSWENARNAEHQSAQRLQRAVAEVASARAGVLEALAAQSELNVLAQERIALEHEQSRVRARIDRQQVAVNKLRITAPESGVVDKSFVNQGEYVVPGQRLVLIHNRRNLWVSANIKETEIRDIKLGTKATIEVDSYPGEVFNGKVFEIGSAATSQFSLLPSANPSGNFTKVTQRIPIKISFDSAGYSLLPGMMVEVALEHD